ncbi:MAG: hypothetical protein GY797_03220 [Deltaproteobacteria bacterium]|nr:hypothetical protein [Deltaproteobacteria bacterium]
MIDEEGGEGWNDDLGSLEREVRAAFGESSSWSSSTYRKTIFASAIFVDFSNGILPGSIFCDRLHKFSSSSFYKASRSMPSSRNLAMSSSFSCRSISDRFSPTSALPRVFPVPDVFPDVL